MEHCRNEWQAGHCVPLEPNPGIMLGRYFIEPLEITESIAPCLMTQFHGKSFQHPYTNTQTAPIIERAPDGSLKAFAEIWHKDLSMPTKRTYARRPASAPRPRPVVRNSQPVASSSQPRPPVVNNRPPPEPMEFDEDEDGAPPACPPSPINPFADERHSDGRYTSRAKGKGRG